MSCADRTAEFQSTASTLRRSGVGAAGLSSRPPLAARATASSVANSAFTAEAKKISVRTQATIDRLTELGRLVSQKSLFANSAGDIEALTALITRGIKENEGAIKQLHAPSGVRGQTKAHIMVILKSLEQNLLWTTLTFKKVLELRGERMRTHSERCSSYGRMELNFTAPPSMGGGGAISRGGGGGGAFPSASVSPAPMGMRRRGSAAPGHGVASGGGGGGGWQATAQRAPTFGNPGFGNPGNPGGGMQPMGMGMGMKGHGAGGGLQQRLHLAASIPQSIFLENRANEMKKVEGTIASLGSMFSRLSTLIQEQNEEVDIIGENLEAAEEDVMAAEGELLQYFALVKSNRGLIVKVFLGLCIFSMTMMVLYG